MKKYLDFIIRMFRMYVLRDKFLLSAKQWFKDDGDNTLRLDYPLNEDSVVFDIGGYEGKFAQEIYDRYKCNIYIFEPVEHFYNKIVTRFENNSKVQVFNFGLSDKNKELLIALNEDASSIHIKGENKESIQLISIIDFIKEHEIEYINLMKINIEGGEYEILPILIDSGFTQKIENIQIQFHNFIDNAEKMRNKIRIGLTKAHETTYEYYFVWENWKLKN